MDCALDIVRLIKDLAVSIAAIVGAYHGGKAIKQWRSEMVGADQYKITKRIALKALEAVEQVHFVRRFYDSSDAVNKIYKTLIMESQGIEKPKAFHQEYIRTKIKLDLAWKSLVELKQLNWSLKVLADIDISNNIDALFEHLGRLSSAAYFYYEAYPQMRNRDEETLEKYSRILHGTKDDEFGKSVENELVEILSLVKRYTTGK